LWVADRLVQNGRRPRRGPPHGSDPGCQHCEVISRAPTTSRMGDRLTSSSCETQQPLARQTDVMPAKAGTHGTSHRHDVGMLARPDAGDPGVAEASPSRALAVEHRRRVVDPRLREDDVVGGRSPCPKRTYRRGPPHVSGLTCQHCEVSRAPTTSRMGDRLVQNGRHAREGGYPRHVTSARCPHAGEA